MFLCVPNKAGIPSMAVWAVLIYYSCLRGLDAAAVSGHVLGGTEIIALYSHKWGISWQEPETVTVSRSGRETHTHTWSKADLKISETYSQWKWCFRRQWKLVMPHCQHWSWFAQYYHIYTHPVAGIQVGQDDSRGTGDGGYLAQWGMGVSHSVKAKLEFTIIINDETVMSDQGLVRFLIRDSWPPWSGYSHFCPHQ